MIDAATISIESDHRRIDHHPDPARWPGTARVEMASGL
jgi:hypothetical protein